MSSTSRLRIGVLLVLIGLVTAYLVTPEDEPQQRTPTAAGAELIADVNYGGHERQRYDVYLPDDDNGPYPALIYIHGGGWTAGDKARSMPVWDWTDDGYAVVSISYRYAVDGDTIAESTADALAAVEHVIAKAADYDIDPDRVGVYGFSSGGHLAAMVAHADVGAAAVAASGSPTDFEELTDPERSVFEIRSSEDAAATIRERLGCATSSCDEAIATLSPARLPAGPAPILVLHGADDVIVSPSQAEALIDRLEADGAPVESRIVPDIGHSPPLDDGLLRDFFARHLRP